MAGKVRYNYKWLELFQKTVMSGNGWKWFEMADNDRKWMEWLDMAGNGWKVMTWLEMVGSGLKLL